MTDKVTIHVSIYVVNSESNDPRSHLKIGYEIEDNDENLLFTNDILKECLASFAKDLDEIYELTPEVLRFRLSEFEIKTVVPPHIRANIEGMIKYIEKHAEEYRGIAVVY
jgi:hypothetical protein